MGTRCFARAGAPDHRGAPRWPLLWQLAGPRRTALLDAAHSSLLLFGEVRYPLRRILLVLGGGEENQPALVWVRRLARPRQSLITLLPLEAAERYPVGGVVARQAQFLDLLEGAGPALRQTRALLPWFTEWQLDVTVHLRLGTPAQIIRSELEATRYDLVITGYGRSPGWWERLRRNVVRGLVARLPTPLLVAQGSEAPFTVDAGAAGG